MIYKPKDLGIDVAYNDLLAWLNLGGAPVALTPLHVLARDGYGWVEFAAPEACRDEDGGRALLPAGSAHWSAWPICCKALIVTPRT